MSDQSGGDASGDNRNDNLSEADYERILRYVSGECATGEELATRAWIERDPQRVALSAELTALREAAPTERGWHTEQWVGRLEDAMRADAGVAPRTPARSLRLVTPARTPMRSRVIQWVAATAAVAAVALVFARREAPTTAPTVAATSESQTYTTGAQQRHEVRLPDGTNVHLAPGSTVRFVAGTNPTRRDVYLQGEAYFVVVHDSTRPFTVYAGNASARDIGTSFSVRSYSEDGATQVVVREGEVALSGAGLLKAGDVGRLGNTGKATVRRGVNVDALLSWVTGAYTWEYRDTELRQVLGDFQRWRGVDVAVSDSTVLERPFTGSLERMSTPEAVGTVAASLGLRVTVEGDRFRLTRF